MYKITILGDIMFQKNMLNFDYKEMFSNVTQYLSESNLVIANLETPIKEEVNEGDIGQFQFVAPKSYVRVLKEIGIDMVSTANNHCLDNGKKGIIDTINILDDLKLEHVGTYTTKKQKRYIVKNIDNKKVVFLANTYGTNAFVNKFYINDNDEFYISMLQKQELNNKIIRQIYNSNNLLIKVIRKIFKTLHIFQFQKQIYEKNEKSYLKEIENEIKEIKTSENPDYILMMMHDGGQNNDKPINRTIEHINYMKKLGINAIITNHEHMIHKVELQDRDIVTYSLGNFMSVNGVLEKPFDKMQDYSIALNIYFENNTFRYTFTIFKIIYDKQTNCITVNNLFDLINSETNKEKKKQLINDNKKIVNKVLSTNDIEVAVKKEYEIEGQKK